MSVVLISIGAIAIPASFAAYKGLTKMFESKAELKKGFNKTIQHQNPTHSYKITREREQVYSVKYALLEGYIDRWPTIRAVFKVEDEGGYTITELAFSSELKARMKLHPDLEAEVEKMVEHMKEKALPYFQNHENKETAMMEKINGVSRIK